MRRVGVTLRRLLRPRAYGGSGAYGESPGKQHAKVLRQVQPSHMLEITTVVGCRNACGYCPQGVLRWRYRSRSDQAFMSLYTFVWCIDKLPPEVGIHFSGFSEPWQNRECTSMLMHAHRRGHPITAFTTGVGMSREDVEILRTIPFLKFRVHLPDHRGFPGAPVDNRYLQAVERLATAGIPGLAYVCPGVQSQAGVHPAVRELLRRAGSPLTETNLASRGLISRAGAVSSSCVRSPVHRTGPLAACAFLTKNVLLPNGDVALCCMDYELKHILGNLLVDDYPALHAGDPFRQVVAALAQGDSNVACRRCELSRPARAGRPGPGGYPRADAQ
jgi:hypothetical protein